MIKFVKIKLDRKNKNYHNINFLENVYHLYKKNERYLNDDYANSDLLEEVLSTVERTSPYFWAILNNDKFAGFIFLENIIGNRENFHSAEITTCIEKEFWGDFTRQVGKKFFRYCFKKYQFKKLKGLVFKENFRIQKLLKDLGMSLEAELRAETIKNGKLQDIEIYSILKKQKKT